MNKILPILPIFILGVTGCGQKPVLRSDISEFISHFSLSESIKEYRKAEYKKIGTDYKNKDGKIVITKITTTVDFDSTDLTNITYSYLQKKEVDGELKETTSESLYKANDTYYRNYNGNVSTCVEDYVFQKINSFFYTEILMETYHVPETYFGDYILDRALDTQSYVTIDSINQLYIFDAEYKDDSQKILRKQTYKVNKLGMLETNVGSDFKDGVGQEYFTVVTKK